MLDLSPREMAVFAPLVVLTLWMGVYPRASPATSTRASARMVDHHTAAMASTAKMAASTLGAGQ